MSADLLSEHFATLATAPNGIARLRELILQLAVQGKLETQDARDKPTSDLIEEIQKEKTALIEKKRLREIKTTELKKIQEMKYEIPPNWTWHSMGEVVFFQEGPGIRNWQFRTMGVKLLNVSNILNNGELELNNSDKYVSEEEVVEKYLHFLIEDKDLLLASSGGSWGKTAWFKDPGYPVILNTSTIRLRFYSEQFAERYLQYFMQTIFFRQQMVSQLVGMQPNFGSTHLSRCYIPLPPLAEQLRIVAKVDRLMAFCDELEVRLQREQAGCLKLGNAILSALQNAKTPEEFEAQWIPVCEAFDLILDCPQNVSVLRQTILQLAVQGRLVRQEPKDEPSRKLVERIKKEKERLVQVGKIKQDKRLELISDKDIRQPVPPTWAITRLGEIAEYGSQIKVLSQEISEDAWVFDLEDLEKDTSRILQKVRFRDRQSLSSKSKFRKGDVLYGKLRPYLNKVVVADEDGYCTTEIVPIRPYLDIDPKYLMYALKTPGFLAYVNSKTYGIKMPRLGTADAINTIIPLPPLSEQHRIVAKVDALMALCDALESRLKERAGVQGRLVAAVVEQVANQNKFADVVAKSISLR